MPFVLFLDWAIYRWSTSSSNTRLLSDPESEKHTQECVGSDHKNCSIKLANHELKKKLLVFFFSIIFFSFSSLWLKFCCAEHETFNLEPIVGFREMFSLSSVIFISNIDEASSNRCNIFRKIWFCLEMWAEADEKSLTKKGKATQFRAAL